jgi:sec-independent protein translocase protein TatA
MSAAFNPMIIGNFGTTEILLILLVLVLLFGAKKLPELARGSGRALRIFKSETKGLMDDDDVDESKKTEEQKQIDAQRTAPVVHPAETSAETRRPETDR